jgi:hypothetical protein
MANADNAPRSMLLPIGDNRGQGSTHLDGELPPSLCRYLRYLE